MEFLLVKICIFYTHINTHFFILETLCCNSISHVSPFHRQFVRTLDGSLLPLHRSLYDRVKFGRARALHCDTPASNGLIHSISRVILPHRPQGNVFGMELWPF